MPSPVTQNQMRSAAQSMVRKMQDESYLFGRLGRVDEDGTVAIHVPSQPNWVYVTMDGAQGTDIALNAGVNADDPNNQGLPVRMVYDQETLTIIGVNTAQLSRFNPLYKAHSTGGTTDWTSITNKPATFPPEDHSHSHSTLLDLTTGDPHPQYLFLAGRSGGQRIDDTLGIDAAPTSDAQVLIHSPVATREALQLRGHASQSVPVFDVDGRTYHRPLAASANTGRVSEIFRLPEIAVSATLRVALTSLEALRMYVTHLELNAYRSNNVGNGRFIYAGGVLWSTNASNATAIRDSWLFGTDTLNVALSGPTAVGNSIHLEITNNSAGVLDHGFFGINIHAVVPTAVGVAITIL